MVQCRAGCADIWYQRECSFRIVSGQRLRVVWELHRIRAAHWSGLVRGAVKLVPASSDIFSGNTLFLPIQKVLLSPHFLHDISVYIFYPHFRESDFWIHHKIRYRTKILNSGIFRRFYFAGYVGNPAFSSVLHQAVRTLCEQPYSCKPHERLPYRPGPSPSSVSPLSIELV